MVVTHGQAAGGALYVVVSPALSPSPARPPGAGPRKPGRRHPCVSRPGVTMSQGERVYLEGDTGSGF